MKRENKSYFSKGKIWGVLFLLVGGYLVYGAILFWGKQYSQKVDLSIGSKDKSDLVIVFAGSEERIPAAFDLIRGGEAKKLVISPATPEQIQRYEKEYFDGNPVPYILETKSTSTHDNAAFCAEIVKNAHAHKVILITSQYHMNRSYRLFSLALKGYPVEIVCYPVYPFGIEDESTMARIPYFQMLNRIEHMNMVFNFSKFLLDGTRIKESNAVEHYLENGYSSIIKKRLSRYEYQKELPASPAVRIK